MKRVILICFAVAIICVISIFGAELVSGQTSEPTLTGYMSPTGEFLTPAEYFALDSQSLIGKYLQVYATAPQCGRPGQMYYDSVLQKQRNCTVAGSPGTWETVASGAGVGTVTNVSVATANGVSGSVATATTTPAITLTLGDITPSKVTQTTNAIGSTSTDGMVIQNTTAAAAGAQQWSPRLRFSGFGWKTSAGGASGAVNWIIENVPVQGTSVPSSQLNFAVSLNGGSFNPKLILGSTDAVTFPALATGGASEFLTVDTNGVVGKTASAGITNSAPPNTIPKTVDGIGNLGASQITDDGNDVNITTSGGNLIATGGVGSTSTITNGTSSIEVSGQSGNDRVNLVATVVSAAAATESLSIDGTAHTITNTAATSISNVTPLWGAGQIGTEFQIGADDTGHFGMITKYRGNGPTDGLVLIGDTAAGVFQRSTLSPGAGVSIINGPGSITIASGNLSATSASIGGGALLAGACASTATTVTGATVGMAAVATPNTYPGDAAYWKSYVSAADTVTVKVCAAIALTPTASTYNIRVIQ